MNQNAFDEYVISLRRKFHQHPELSGKEKDTRAVICAELEKLGIPYDIVDAKNVIGCIKNGSGKRIAFRADIDALPVEEQVDVPWKSNTPGVMHACGHDAHTAALLGAAKLFAENLSQWHGTVYLCFQCGEEAGIGAAECVQYLQEQGGVDAAFAVHMLSILPPGLINLQPGVRANGGITFHIDIQGKSGHGARPDVAVSAAEIMCDTYQQLLRIPSNHHEAAKTCVISPCVLRSGTRFNVIPGGAVIEGTIRFMGIEDGAILEERVRHVAEAVAAFHGGTAQVQFTPVARYPVVNDEKMTAIGREAAEAVGFKHFDMPNSSASDNFAEFLHAFPGYYCFVGSQSSRPGTSGIHHAPDFDLDESVLPRISFMFLETAKRLENM